MATVLITGGTGLIGSALTRALIAKGDQVIILTRNKQPQTNPKILYAEWNLQEGTIDSTAVQQSDYIIHLAGANVADKRWTEERKKEILDSRTQSGALIVKALQTIPNKIQAVISASAIGWYGPDPKVPNSKPFREEDPPFNDFLGQTCVQWEDSIRPVTDLGKRLVLLRTGIVLSKEGGAYKEFKKPMQLGVAPVLGSGKQVISWIHIDDLVRLYLYAMENKNISGIFNAAAPHPVSNHQLISTMKKHAGFSIQLPVPSFALKTILGEMSIEVLKSTTVSSDKIRQTGFQFRYGEIDAAVQQLIKKAS